MIKRAVLAFLSAVLLSYLLSIPINLMGPIGTYTEVSCALIPLMTVLIYYGHSIQQLLRGQQMKDDAEEDGEKSKEETLQEDSSPAEPASK